MPFGPRSDFKIEGKGYESNEMWSIHQRHNNRIRTNIIINTNRSSRLVHLITI